MSLPKNPARMVEESAYITSDATRLTRFLSSAFPAHARQHVMHHEDMNDNTAMMIPYPILRSPEYTAVTVSRFIARPPVQLSQNI